MPRKIIPLSDIACRNAKGKEKSYRLFDGGGLYLEISPTGSKSWRYKYDYAGKEKRLTIGSYPETGLAEARDKHRAAHKQVQEGLDPSAEKKVKRLTQHLSANTTFEGIAREWFEKRKEGWVDSYSGRLLARLEKDVFPYVGTRPISSITTAEILAFLHKIERRGAIETAHRTKSDCAQIFKYAIGTARATHNPCGNIGIDALKTPISRSHAAVTDPKDIGQLMRAMRGYTGTAIVRAALLLAPLVFLRPGELRQAEWTEFDLDGVGRFPGSGPMWEIPAARMKLPKQDKLLYPGHLVPLSRQAVEILRSLRPLTGKGRYVFPSARTTSRPMSNVAVLAALRRMGYTGDEMTGHGFRATARTAIRERLKLSAAIIELQLAHAVKDPNGRAYDRTSFLDERADMMQTWANYLDTLADTVPTQTSADAAETPTKANDAN